MQHIIGAILAAVALASSVANAEPFGFVKQGCFGTPGASGVDDPEIAQGMRATGAAVVQAIQNALQSAAQTQLSGGSIGAAVPTYQPLTKLRSFKRNLDVYVNPTVSLETKTGRFVSAKAAADALRSLGMEPSEAAELWTDSNALVGVLVDDTVVALTPELAENMKVPYQDLIEGVVSSAQNPAALDRCYESYGYIFDDENLEPAKLVGTLGPDEPPAVITWGYRSSTLPNSTAEMMMEWESGT